jgi:hypothetical protein
VNEINGRKRDELYNLLLKVAKRKTETADKKIDESGKFVDPTESEYGDNVLIVSQESSPPAAATEAASPPKRKLRKGKG